MINIIGKEPKKIDLPFHSKLNHLNSYS